MYGILYLIQLLIVGLILYDRGEIMGFILTSNDIYDDIIGQEYKEFITLCFNYSKYFSLSYQLMQKENNKPNLFGVNEIEKLQKFVVNGFIDNELGTHTIVRMYKCTEESQFIIQNYVNSLFAWQPYWEDCHNPEDLTFFREDASVFSYTSSHNENCEVYNRKGEDVHVLLLNKKWERFDGECRWLFPLRASNYIKQ